MQGTKYKIPGDNPTKIQTKIKTKIQTKIQTKIKTKILAETEHNSSSPRNTGGEKLLPILTSDLGRPTVV